MINEIRKHLRAGFGALHDKNNKIKIYCIKDPARWIGIISNVPHCNSYQFEIINTRTGLVIEYKEYNSIPKLMEQLQSDLMEILTDPKYIIAATLQDLLKLCIKNDLSG